MILEPNSTFLKNHRIVFVTNTYGSVTCFMKCILPSRAIALWEGNSIVLDLKSFYNYCEKEEFKTNDIVVLSKVVPYFSSKTFSCLEKIKEKVKFIFSEASEESSFEVFSVEGEKFYSINRENMEDLERFTSYLDGYLYESDMLRSRIKQYFPNTKCFQVRHLHSNCHNMINPTSPIGREDNFINLEKISAQFYKKSILENFKTIGYLGRPMYCSDFFALTRATYSLSHKTRRTLNFYTSNPGCHDNIQETLKVDFAFSYMEENANTQHYFNYKTANKVTGLWSLGIPGLFSPLPTYKRVFKENNLDFDKWSIPDKINKRDSAGSIDEWRTSIEHGEKIANKIESLISQPDFEEERAHLFKTSVRYNPMNVWWLYEDMFNYCK